MICYETHIPFQITLSSLLQLQAVNKATAMAAVCRNHPLGHQYSALFNAGLPSPESVLSINGATFLAQCTLCFNELYIPKIVVEVHRPLSSDIMRRESLLAPADQIGFQLHDSRRQQQPHFLLTSPTFHVYSSYQRSKDHRYQYNIRKSSTGKFAAAMASHSAFSRTLSLESVNGEVTMDIGDDNCDHAMIDDDRDEFWDEDDFVLPEEYGEVGGEWELSPPMKAASNPDPNLLRAVLSHGNSMYVKHSLADIESRREEVIPLFPGATVGDFSFPTRHIAPIIHKPWNWRSKA